MDPNRKTNIPIRPNLVIIAEILKSCTLDELLFMSRLAGSQRDFGLFSSILTRMTESNIHAVFYAKGIEYPEQIMNVWIGKRGEVAGLKAFQQACQAASVEIARRQKILRQAKQRREEEDV